MEEQQIAEMVKKEVAAWFASQQKQTDGYEYEKTFVECWRVIGQKVFQQSLGKIPGSKNEKKKLKSSLGDVVIPKTHFLSQTPNGFLMTPYLQDQVCYVGQAESFDEGCESLHRFMGIEVSGKQIQRISEYFGQCLEQNTEKLIEEDSPGKVADENSTKITYGMPDGSMVYTREEGWKEIKAGRVFKAEENIPVTESRHWIKKSKYCVYLGGFEQFLERFELLIKGIHNLVFIADGAKWFWEWASIYYPNVIQILDYFHCKEYLCEYARLIFKDEKQRKKWIKKQETLLFQDKIEKVIESIKSFTELSGEAKKYQEKITTYYENNKTRMLYGTYRKKQLLIGSGPIESAHRNLIQKRLKQSGQRWSRQGAQQIASLRAVHKSNEWDNVKNIIKYGMAA